MFVSGSLDPRQSDNLFLSGSAHSMSNTNKEANNSTAATKLCELCDEEPINVKFLPCGHAVICSLCASRAVKCLECKVLLSQ